MANHFLGLAVTPAVQAAQAKYYGRAARLPRFSERDELGPAEQEFIIARESFYLASVSEDGWPYIQHRGGPRGFLHVLDEHTLGFADYRGNRQLLTTGNVSRNDHVALFLMDYPKRARLKILGHARILDAREHPAEVERLAEPGLHGLVERVFLIDVVALDWNCAQHITPRYSVGEVERLVAPLKQRIAELEGRRRSVE
jgi:predicted pyridoxine 5'-phosphate oxidase superfamily flavin-nucleotide-binding protein